MLNNNNPTNKYSFRNKPCQVFKTLVWLVPCVENALRFGGKTRLDIALILTAHFPSQFPPTPLPTYPIFPTFIPNNP